MATARSLLREVRRLQAAHDAPAIARFGTPEFEAQIRAEVAERKLDRIDMLGEDGKGGVLAALQGWARDRVWR